MSAATRCACVGRRTDADPHCDLGANPHAAYYAAKARVVEALTELGATSPETAVIGAKLGIMLDDDAYMVAARGAEVRHRAGVGYWVGRTRNNGRA